jgi:spore coat polysaccharide biosynthesis protein SpsF
MKTCAIIQARMSSKRLPGKVLCEINSRPLLSYVLERVAAAKRINKIILATSTDVSDDPIAQLCKKNDILFYRGSLNDVLDRYYQAAREVKADIIVRLTGDCPLIDPRMIDDIINTYKNGNYDYVANTIPPKWSVPDGMDVEVFSFRNLEQAWREAKKPSEREHVTFYFWKNPEIFSIYRYNLDRDLSNYRLTVDYAEDLKVVTAIITNLYPKNALFTLEDIINFLSDNPDIYRINAHIKSHLGWQLALEKDKKTVF